MTNLIPEVALAGKIARFVGAEAEGKRVQADMEKLVEKEARKQLKKGEDVRAAVERVQADVMSKLKGVEMPAKKSATAAKAAKGSSATRVAPVATAVNRTMGKAVITNKGDRTYVRHREMVRDVPLGTTASMKRKALGQPGLTSGFEVDGIGRINPGNKQLFPYLSTIAKGFEKYTFKDLAFELLTMAPTSAQGSMMLAVDMDAADRDPASKRELLNFEGAARGPVWDQIVRCVVPKRLLSLAENIGHFIRDETIPQGADIKTYDTGKLIVASDDLAADATAELWASYDVELSVPTLEEDVPSYALRCYSASSAVYESAFINADLSAHIASEFSAGDCDFLPVPINGSDKTTAGLVCRSPGTYLATGSYMLTGSGLSGSGAMTFVATAGLVVETSNLNYEHSHLSSTELDYLWRQVITVPDVTSEGAELPHFGFYVGAATGVTSTAAVDIAIVPIALGAFAAGENRPVRTRVPDRWCVRTAEPTRAEETPGDFVVLQVPRGAAIPRA